MNEDLKEFLLLLNAKKVDYLLVGGYAVGFHGYPRYTGDLDIWYEPTEENAKNLLLVLKEFGFGSLNITMEDMLKKGEVIQLGYPPYRIDLINECDGIEFAACYKRKIDFEYENIQIKLLSLDDLITNKKAAGRTKDKLDIENISTRVRKKAKL
jgi:hypothetical protein